MTTPPDPDNLPIRDAEPDDVDALEGDLGTVTDEEWLVAHKRLIDSGAVPLEETAYLYDPDRDPATVTEADLSTDRDPAEPDDG